MKKQNSGDKPGGRKTSGPGRKPSYKKEQASSGSKPSRGYKRFETDNDAGKKSPKKEKKEYDDKKSTRSPERTYGTRKPVKKSYGNKEYDGKPSGKPRGKKYFDSDDTGKKGKFGRTGKDFKKPYKKSSKKVEEKVDDGTIRLNKYLSNAGICSRREADTYIQSGVVSVNGQIVTELGYKVQPGDKVSFGGKTIKAEKFYYVLLNKPKDYLTTASDPKNRKTVMELVSGAAPVKLFPVGRLDRNTTGVLLLTNDGDMANRLMHPRKGVQKLYKVELNKSFSVGHLEKLAAGMELEDGFFQPDEVAFVAGESKKIVGIRIHSGRNRIVRRLFEHLGYEVIKLDRVIYAGLDKKGLTRGKWRHLTQEELNILKMI